MKTLVAQGEARRRNFRLLSGRQGKPTTRDMLAVLNDTSNDDWAGVAMSTTDRHATGLSLICGMADAWFRRVFAYGEPGSGFSN